MNHLVWIILDSCRFDSFLTAHTANFRKIGDIQKRYSYASWTVPAHHVFLTGLLPHESPQQVFASEVYKDEFFLWKNRLAVPELSFSDFIPELNLVIRLKKLGYRCVGRVSMPVLNPHTSLAAPFDDYRLMDDHNNFAAMVEELSFTSEIPVFYFLNLGETHYPYMLDDPKLPHISGVHGVFKRLDNFLKNGKDDEQVLLQNTFYSEKNMHYLKKQQIKAVEYCDLLFGKLLEKSPANTYFIITSDHGELFGEDGYFGHGPIMHEKVFEVPLVEGLHPGSLHS